MLIKIDPLDTIFFRDGKPFSMGEDSWGNCIFPPSPSVIYGAIRTVYFSNHIDLLEKANTEEDPTNNLVIRGIYFLDNLENKNTLYLPLPLDLVQKKDVEAEMENEVNLLSLVELKLKSSCPTSHVLKGDQGVQAIDNGLISGELLKGYLSCNSKNFSILRLNSRVITEPKIGIGLSGETHTADESKIYRVGMKRLKNLSFLVEFEGLEIPEKGLLKLGGEGKAASYEKISEQLINCNYSEKNLNKDIEKFKLYLSTPAIFHQGWLPSWIDMNSLEGKYKNLKFKLLTASIGKYQNIGGFDLKQKKPKPMWRATPAGSVYYFKIIEGDIKEIYSLFNKQSISDEYAKQGFGITFVGKVNE
ncbi:MAG TPA: type III-B CRISPR module-associated protein Cmr3 [Methanosarcina thermophila]|uniref:CRISPR-associated RAMP Cmr3 n=1 Tax=Methanosarcina thermophila (strain ATCC 43570 / DSM 1825 / OCM 12 / VKM B-1830 / TM-1) TaxID=523844 RepID=A0A0E3KQ27_METTT|nr:type III-B CRISPR module-associated protein Cmr3 [Methanosarcina thermophila]AKB13725.1 CRISPR-associated RAMP Cmr3 [Methanosarcina thermophila TM-1]HOQ66110.1 type III-B CRISPR module-associated protein Cmr3 [Methanosarcina thermophila]HPT80463.1 type III-B CRISPR module-associated protein Cmr3 [Methanosarcina thermophila]